MVFVKISTFHWIVIHILHYISIPLELLSVCLFLVKISNTIDIEVIPQIDKDGFLKLSDYVNLINPQVDAFLFNTLMITLFWIAHIKMSSTAFKQNMNNLTNNLYYYYDRSVFNMTAGKIMTLIIFLYQPIDIVLFEGFNNNYAKYLALVMQVFSIYYFLQTFWDLRESDTLGFDHFRHFKREGTEFPMPFKMKYMSRAGFSSRHPLMTFFLTYLLSTVLYGPITFGRLLLVGSFFVSILIGVHHEEQELIKMGGKGFQIFMNFIPNLFIPDLKMFFMSVTDYKKFENSFWEQLAKVE
ncbi:UNKNOWN [Stylonychia lemnae]|uniref:Uncharacterized protein n=1 Tax=Stylonychia lemnae TaxID=5949 RepID=A0A078ACT1_STYLE|nr:UNKNOWN [Stylonychia lemnae]|eukprot:CDW80065.1 UNKNOWN [Stylonychia lemnae]